MERLMKITKQRLKEIIREELQAEVEDDAMRGAERPGAGIEDIAATEDEETRDRAFGSPEERLITLINARDVLNKMTPADLEALSLSLDAPMVATLRHILANPMYAPTGGQGHEMELEEYRGEPERKKSAPRPSSDTRSSNTGYRSGATGKRNQGRGGW